MAEMIQKVTRDIDSSYQFNTVIAACMEFFNAIGAAKDELLQDDTGKKVLASAFTTMVILLSPMMPHLCGEIWEATGHTQDLSTLSWPEADSAALVRDEITVIIQINGKLRARLNMPPDADQKAMEKAALAEPGVAKFLENTPVRKVIVVPGKLVNIVV